MDKSFIISKNAILSIIFCLVVCIPDYISAQYFCGEIKHNSEANLSNDDLIGSAQDRFGNIYTQKYIQSLKPKQSTYKSPINTGYFDLSFNDFPETIEAIGHPNFGQDIRPVICQVFADITEIIQQRTQFLSCGDPVTTQTVNILIRTNVCGDDPNCDNATSQVAGTASPLFSFTDNFNLEDTCFPVTESLVWKKMNSEELLFPFGFDGLLNINVENIDFDYQLDTENPVSSEKLDLYSIVLHEVLHIMGFASRINDIGEPINAQLSTTNYFSRYDQFLHITDAFIPNGQSQNTERLMQGDCEANCFVLNENIQDFEDLTANHCGTAEYDIVFAETGIAPVYGTNNGELDIANGLSHLREDCNGSNADYVMDPFISKGDDERTISDEELNILCKLGYNINQENGIACDGCYAHAHLDHTSTIGGDLSVNYYQSCCYSPLLAKIEESFIFDTDFLLCNDFYQGEAEITEVYVLGVNWATASLEDLGDGMYEFIGVTPGPYRVYYTIKDCNCYLSTAYFEIVLSRDLEDCDNEKCDNLVCIGDFESIKKTNDFYYEACKEDLFFMEGANQNTPDICESANNKYLDLVNIIGAEATLIELDYPILPGCTMEITVDLATRGDNELGLLNMYGSFAKPCHPSEVFIKQQCNETQNILVDNICDNYSYQPYCILDDETISNTFSGGLTLCPDTAVDFENYSWSVKNDFGEDINYIVLYNKTQPSVIWLDNLDIRSECPPEVSYEVQDSEVEEGEIALMEIEVCFSDEAYPGFDNTDVQILVNLPPNVNFALGGDFVNGIAVISGLEQDECVTLQLAVQSDVQGSYNIEYIVQVQDLCKEIGLEAELLVKEKTAIIDFSWDEIPEHSTVYLVNILGQAQKLETLSSIRAYQEKYARNHVLGVYFLQVLNDGALIHSQKIIMGM